MIEHLGTLSVNETGNYTTEINLVSFCGSDPKLDIRKWDRKNDKMLKGITLNKPEAQILYHTLERFLKDG